jgi:uncharacterized damage-inducible protein DinB
MSRELDDFIQIWDAEARRTAELLRALPADRYDFRPDPKGRSIGEMAWHLAELDAYPAHGILRGAMSFTDKPEGVERPRTVAELAPGYENLHRAASDKLRGMRDLDFEKSITFFDGKPMPIRRILWDAMLHHMLHHRGQLVLMCRLAGGTPPGLYGPNRETTEAMKAART